jgi:hypothetical protein
MTTILDRYMSDKGDVLIPINNDLYPKMVSDKGIYYFSQTHDVVAIVAGNPMGLLLTLTYSATP